MRSFSCRPRRSLDWSPTAKLTASIKFDFPARGGHGGSRRPQMREERRGRRTRAIRPDDRREVAERADDLPAAVRLPILDLEAVEAAALLRHCESRAVGGSRVNGSYHELRLSRYCPGSKGLVCSKDDSHDDHPRSTRRRRRRRSVAGGSAIPTTSRGAPGGILLSALSSVR